MEPFDDFYARFRGPVLGFFARRVGEPEVAADLMAETFARALVRYRKVPPDAPEAWLFTIARNLLIDSARRGRVEDSARRKLRLESLQLDDDDLQRIAQIAEAADLARDVRAALSPAEYEALHARAVDEESSSSWPSGCGARRRSCANASAGPSPTPAQGTLEWIDGTGKLVPRGRP